MHTYSQKYELINDMTWKLVNAQRSWYSNNKEVIFKEVISKELCILIENIQEKMWDLL